nr:EAL domain-containing protein [Lysinibacillus timonensis]
MKKELLKQSSMLEKQLFENDVDNMDLKGSEDVLNEFQKLRETFNDLDYICSFYYDSQNDFLYFSRQFRDILKLNSETQITPTLKHVLRYVHPEDREQLKNAIQAALEDGVNFQIEYRIVRQDETVRLVHEQAEILLDELGNVNGLVGFIQDIIDSELSVRVLNNNNQLKLLYDNLDIGIWATDLLTGECIHSSKGIEYITGYTKDEMNEGFEWASVVHKEDLQQYLDNQHKLAAGSIIQHQYRIINKHGDLKWIQDYTIPSVDANGNVYRLDGITSDITEQKRLEEKIQYLANYDYLTNLPNRNKFIEMLNHQIEEYANSDNQFAVVKIDIDGFKYVNDTVGNAVGDEILKQFAGRLADHLQTEELLARRGGDEFMILLHRIESIPALINVAQQINDSINEPFYINEYKLYITASLGISTYPENGKSSLELLRNANLALQYAKKEGKNNYHILSQTSSIQSFKNYSIGRDLKKAVGNREMMLYYQPRVDANSNEIIGAEALIRWNHPEWGMISPHEFLSIAEENGLITDIDSWVLAEACHRIKEWKNRGIQVVPISINISALHFMKPDWPRKVATTIRDTGIQPNDIEFEITESTLLNNSETVIDCIFKLKELGIRISLDDFGKGYSSLSYLTQYPFDVIKIDRSFIRNMHISERDLHLTKSIIYMAKGLQLRVVAEGVETTQQLEILQQEQCHEIQGYLFSQPVPLNEFEILLQNRVLLPIDPEQKAQQNRRKHDRLNFPYPLEADIKLLSIAGRSMELGVSKVLIENISIGGLKFVSTLKLPIRGDVIYQFETELLDEAITFNGNIVWKNEINEDLMEYGIQFTAGEEEQTSFTKLLNDFINLLKNSSHLPPYRKVDVDRYQYFK